LLFESKYAMFQPVGATNGAWTMTPSPEPLDPIEGFLTPNAVAMQAQTMLRPRRCPVVGERRGGERAEQHSAVKSFEHCASSPFGDALALH
jgi:hypothetical protein